MTQLGEAITRYHKIIESDPVRSSNWIAQLREKMAAHHLVVQGRPLTPVLRPHLLTRKQYTSLVATGEALNKAIERMRLMVIADPALMSRMALLPAEKMLGSLDPGYTTPAVASLLDAFVNNGSMHLTGSQTDLPTGVLAGDVLADLFFETAPVKEFRKKYKLAKPGGPKALVQSILKAWKEFGGKTQPRVAIVEFRQPFATLESVESQLLAELLRQNSLDVDIVSPEELDYRGTELTRNGTRIDVVYRCVRSHDFLLKFDLTHPLVRAYRDRKVCLVNSFRMELSRKKAMLALLTDDRLTARFPAAELKAIQESIPKTRVVAAAKTTWGSDTVDLPEFIRHNRDRLVLRPNDDASSELPTVEGAQCDDTAWNRALQVALRNPYVVQERVETHPVSFPVDLYGEMAYRDLNVEVFPHAFLGKVHGCTSRILVAAGGYSSLSGLAPTFIVEAK